MVKTIDVAERDSLRSMLRAYNDHLQASFLGLGSGLGLVEPCRQDGENAQNRGKTGKQWARYGLRSAKEES